MGRERKKKETNLIKRKRRIKKNMVNHLLSKHEVLGSILSTIPQQTHNIKEEKENKSKRFKNSSQN
jgi:hypothetical protein